MSLITLLVLGLFTGFCINIMIALFLINNETRKELEEIERGLK